MEKKPRQWPPEGYRIVGSLEDEIQRANQWQKGYRIVGSLEDEIQRANQWQNAEDKGRDSDLDRAMEHAFREVRRKQLDRWTRDHRKQIPVKNSVSPRALSMLATVTPAALPPRTAQTEPAGQWVLIGHDTPTAQAILKVLPALFPDGEVLCTNDDRNRKIRTELKNRGYRSVSDTFLKDFKRLFEFRRPK